MGGLDPDQDGSHTGRELMASILAGTQEQLEIYLNRPIEYVQIREVVRSNSRGFLYLSVTPVRKIISCGVTTAYPTDLSENFIPPVMERDNLLDEEARLVDKTLEFGNGQPLVVPGGLQIGGGCSNYLVEYIGGYKGYADSAMKLGIMRVAAREYGVNNVSTAGMEVGQIDQTKDGDRRNVGWTTDELVKFQRHRRRIIIS